MKLWAVLVLISRTRWINSLLGVITKDLTALCEGGFASDFDPSLYAFSKIILLQQMMNEWVQFEHLTFNVKKDSTLVSELLSVYVIPEDDLWELNVR